MEIIIGIIGIGVIVFIHELGHFVSAKYYKVDVLEFAVGMGPKLFSYTWKNTLYSIRVLPLGGFCRMKSPLENIENINKNEKIPHTEGTIFAVSFFKKAVILLAGPVANIIFYLFLSLFLFLTGYKTATVEPRIEPILNGPAFHAGLVEGDYITKIDGKIINSFDELPSLTQQLAGQQVEIEYKRNESIYSQTVNLNTQSPILGVYPFIAPVITYVKKLKKEEQVFKVNDTILRINDTPIYNAIHMYKMLNPHRDSIVTITVKRNEQEIPLTVFVRGDDILASLGIQFYTIQKKRWASFAEFLQDRTTQMITMVTSTAKFIFRLIVPHKDKETSITGPIGIISIIGGNTLLAGKSYGLMYALWQFINISAILSFTIALMNIIPIPVLDGGQLLFYASYALVRRTPTYKSLTRFHTIGTIIMLLLFIFVMFKDISALI